MGKDLYGNFELGALRHYLGEKLNQRSKAGERGRFASLVRPESMLTNAGDITDSVEE
jgi:hypothetical protein